MKTRIQKWGNSLGLRIPRSLAAEAQVSEGSEVDVSLDDGCLRIRPLRVRKYVLRDLLKGINQSNLHTEASTGDPVGKELW